LAQITVFSQATQQPLQVDWASHIQTSIPQAHMTCDDDVLHNAIVKETPSGLAGSFLSCCTRNLQSKLNLGVPDMQTLVHVCAFYSGVTSEAIKQYLERI
nr:hypothetical protein [Tanacetum cinerariifolium]